MKDFNEAAASLDSVLKSKYYTSRLRYAVDAAQEADTRKTWMRVGYVLARLVSQLEERDPATHKALDRVKEAVGEL